MPSLTDTFCGRGPLALLPGAAAVAVVCGTLVAAGLFMAEDRVAQQHVAREMARFECLYTRAGPGVPLPSTSYLESYWQDDRRLPARLSELGPGIHAVDHGLRVAVAEPAGATRPLVMVLDASKFSPLGERRSFVLALAGALAGLVISAAGMLAIVPARRLHAAIRREACFTRHVSHELRTPLAIARNALSVVTLPDCGQEKRARNLARIDQACREIETVVETFLQLGREEGQAGEAAVAVVALRPAVEKYVEKFTRAGRPGAPHVAIGGDAGAAAVGHAPMIEMVLGNLLQNALVHGTGQVIVCLGPGVVEIRNPLSNASVASPPGHGYGLEIVRRICDHNRWRFSEHRSEGIFLARVYFRAP